MPWWFNIFLKMFFLLTPFFVLSSFISMTDGFTPSRRRITAIKMGVAIAAICFVLFWFGGVIFNVFGITLDSFRVGTGVLLILSAISLVRGGADAKKDNKGEISVVPLAIPIAVGPGTIGAVMVYSTELETFQDKFLALTAILAAALLTGLFCLLSEAIRKVLGVNGLAVLSKLTGLVIAALAAQFILGGVKGYLGL
ncbi:MAG: MarC family protein [Spirochaetota bacterium]